ncbi:hypothetical protein K438DRAFT_2113038, partial [Mycena galopus ATCC 62051]
MVLACICLEQWKAFRVLDVLNSAVCAFDDVLRDGLADTLTVSLGSLGVALLHRIEQFGDIDDISKCVSVMERVVEQTPEGQSDKPTHLSNLGISLLNRFERLGGLDDLEKSVFVQEDALRMTPEGHPDKPGYLNHLGAALSLRFERLGDLDDLNNQSHWEKAAVCLTPEGHPVKLGYLNNLGSSFFYRFARLGDLDDLHKSVSIQEDAVCLTPEGHPFKLGSLNNLGQSLSWRFARLGDLDDLNKSASVQEDAVHLTPEGHPHKAALLDNLGHLYVNRFQLSGHVVDLQDAVLRISSSAHLKTGPAHIRFNAARKWAICTRLQEDFLNAYHIAMDLLPELAWLSLSITDRYYHLLKAGEVVHDEPPVIMVFGNPDKVVEWVEQGRSEICSRLLDLLFVSELAPQQSPEIDRVNRHAVALDGLLKKIRALQSFEKLLVPETTVSELIHGVCAGQKEPIVILNLSAKQCHALICTNTNDRVIHIPLTDFTPENEGRMKEKREGELPPHDQLAQIRFESARHWAKYTRFQEDLLNAHHVAMALLQELAWLGLSITDRHHHLLTAGEVVRDAAAVAIASGNPQKAVEWLEQGRSIIWSQLFNLRTPVDTLNNSHPVLAKDLLFLSMQLEGSGHRNADGLSNKSGTQQSIEPDKAHQYASARDALLKEIRGLENF